MDHVSYFVSGANGVLGYVSIDVAELQVVGSVQHAAVSVASALDKGGVGVLLCRSCEHNRTVKVLCEQGFCDLRTEIAEVYAQSVAACLLDILKSLDHVDLALNDTDGTFVDVRCAVLVGVSLDDSLASVNGKALGEAVTGYCNYAKLDFRNVGH